MFSTLFEKIMFFVLEALNLTFHLVAQLEIFRLVGSGWWAVMGILGVVAGSVFWSPKGQN